MCLSLLHAFVLYTAKILLLLKMYSFERMLNAISTITMGSGEALERFLQKTERRVSFRTSSEPSLCEQYQMNAHSLITCRNETVRVAIILSDGCLY